MTCTNANKFILVENESSVSDILGRSETLADTVETSLTEETKFILDKYYDVIKLRAAQSLALFLVYGLALRESREFLDGNSIVAMVIPIAAWFLDMTARRHYGAPLAYAAIRHGRGINVVDAQSKEHFSLSEIIFDFKLKHSDVLADVFAESISEKDRRMRFSRWYTWKDQLIPVAVFLIFFVIAILFHRT